MIEEEHEMFKRYLNDTSGQFAIMFAVCATAMIIAAGSAVDMIGIQKQKTQLQALTDSAVLAAAAAKTDNIGDLKKIAQAALEANNPTARNIDLKLSLNGEIIQVAASYRYTTQLMGIVGIKDIPVKATSEAPIPKDIPLNIALVLDRTGSMAGSNMASLKSASATLIEIFSNFDGEVKAGVVPFSNYVNVGVANRDQIWMDVPDDTSTTATEETCHTTKDLVSPDLCTTETRSTTRDGVPIEVDYKSCPESAYGPEYEQCYFPTSSETWYGCVGSREGTLNVTPDYRNKQFPGIMNAKCGEEILPLTTNISSVKAKIDSLTASGATYIPAGLAWGWRMLDSKQPYNDLSNSQADRKRAIVLMTDGANTLSLEQPFHNGSDTDAANGLTADLCTRIKKEGIQLFTVAYQLSDTSKTKDVIRICATTESFFFDATNTADLEQAFEDIGRSLYEVRLTK